MNQRNFKKQKEKSHEPREHEPREWDAVAGNANNILDNRAVLGGLPGLLKKWKAKDLNIQINAIENAHNYGIEGLRLLIEATWNSDKEIRKKAARRLVETTVILQIYLHQQMEQVYFRNAAKYFSITDIITKPGHSLKRHSRTVLISGQDCITI